MVLFSGAREVPMTAETIERPESKETVSYSVPAVVVRAIEYRAFLDRSNKSEAMARLVQAGAAALQQRTPEGQERVA
jgi:hypothetical protein